MAEPAWSHAVWFVLILVCDVLGTMLLVCILNICVEYYCLRQRRRDRRHGDADADLELGLAGGR